MQKETLLEPPDYRAILAVLEAVGRARTVREFERLALEAIADHLDYSPTTFLIGGPPDRDSTHGREKVDLDEYSRHPTSSDPFVAPGAIAWLRNRVALDGTVFPAQRRYLDEFLLLQSNSQLTLWLDTDLPHHGYLSIFGRGSKEFGARDRATLMALRPHLSSLLRGLLLEGRRAPGTEGLSERETELAQLVGIGFSNREIAHHLGIQVDTVKKHLANAMQKVRVRNRTQLALALRGSESS
jgi:DNA-binding CsgD family transcriptional regulator